MSRIFRVHLTPSLVVAGAVALAWDGPDDLEGEELIPTDTAIDLSDRALSFTRERAGARQWVELAWKLYSALNIGRCALRDFHGSGRPPLELRVRAEGSAAAWPFELIRMLFDIRIVREVETDRSCSVSNLDTVEDRMLLLMFMACAPQFPGDDPGGGQLYFEQEEEAIFQATRSGAVELDVEDTGSLSGLAERLGEEKFDVIHVSCHANIVAGAPCLFMETDMGEPHSVGPEILWENCLKLRPPHIVFLSACRTGENSSHEAAASFCEKLVGKGLPMAIGWGISVADPNATRAAQIFYGELSLGITALEALAHTREKLMNEGDMFWPFLRVFIQPEIADFAIVSPPAGRKRLPKRRTTRLKQLGDAGVNVLMEGFVGRRREIQRGLRALRDTETPGLLIHGAGGLGKSCLAGKFVERFPERGLIIVNGVLDEASFTQALLKGFSRSENLSGIRLIKERGVDFLDKIPVFCSTVFRETPYIILLDAFERNIVVKNCVIKGIAEPAKNILDSLTENLPECMGVTKLLITSRYRPSLAGFIEIPMRSMRGADEKKKIERLNNLNSLPQFLRDKLVEDCHGNPALMERINRLAGGMKGSDIEQMLVSAEVEKEKFVSEQTGSLLLELKDSKFKRFLSEVSVFETPVPADGFASVSNPHASRNFLERALSLGLIEMNALSGCETSFMVSPTVRAKFFSLLSARQKKLLRNKGSQFLAEQSDNRSPRQTGVPPIFVPRGPSRNTTSAALNTLPGLIRPATVPQTTSPTIPLQSATRSPAKSAHHPVNL